MKNSVLVLLPVNFYIIYPSPAKNAGDQYQHRQHAENLFIIITDGFRWQEIFSGADSVLINDENFTPDTATLKAMYWASDPSDTKKKANAFFMECDRKERTAIWQS